MAMNICEALLNDEEYRRFYFVRQPAEVCRQIQFGLDAAALLEAGAIPLKSRSKTHFIQKGRMQQVRNCSEFTDAVLGQQHCLFESFVCSRGTRFSQTPDHRQIHL